MDSQDLHPVLLKLRSLGWKVAPADHPRLVCGALAARYPCLPAELEHFLCKIGDCVSADGTTWLITADHYASTADSDGFRWNEYELMEKEWALGDAEWAARVEPFWNRHFPFMLAVHSDYDYLAINVADGSVVHGSAPDWHDTSVVATSFGVFLKEFERQITTGASFPYSLFLPTHCD